jgi:hypothetical protein
VSPTTALFVFLGIPLAVAVVVAVAVYASSWTRSGRASADYGSGPFMVVSDPAVPDPARLPSELAAASGNVAGGGVSARW